MLENLQYLRPEIFLSIYAMLLLMVGVFKKDNATISNSLFLLSILGFALVIYILYNLNSLAITESKTYQILALNRSFVFDNFAYLIKIIISIASLSVCIIAMNSRFYAGTNQNVFEVSILILLSVVGMFLLVSANDLMSFYIGLELQSLALYVLVAVNRDSEQSTESGVKYFVLGALASGIILFGSSLIYGFSGSTNLGDISGFLKANQGLEQGISPAVIFGFVLILAGLFFKLSAVPMHMWAPDVYEGSTKTILAFIATAPKVAAIAFLIRFIEIIDSSLFMQFSKIIVVVSALSMILGSFAALRQTNIKRLLSYSSIANMGYILIALSIGSQAAIQSATIYILIYVIASVGIFAIVSILQNDEQDLEKISDFSGLAKSNPVYAMSLAILMFSVAGIPPMAGFLGKFFVFKEAISFGYITLAIIGVITSVVSAFYYLKIIKIMYFDDAAIINEIKSQGAMLKLLVGFSVAFTLLMILFTSAIINMVNQATLSLF